MTFWLRLEAFAFCVFNLPGSSRKDRKTSLATLVKKNILAFDAGNFTPSCVQRNLKQSNNDAVRLRKRVESKILDGDIRGAVRVLASEEMLAVPNVETVEILKSKHPQGRDIIDPANRASIGVHETPEVTSAEIVKAVNSFPNGSAGGLDGLRPQHLKDMLGGKQDESTRTLLRALAEMVTLMLRGQVQEEVCQYLYGANLTALMKKDGGIRPIAVGNTLRRLAAKVMGNRIQEEVGQQLRPCQLGYGTRGGAEAAVHAARSFLCSRSSAGSKVFLKIDFRNAFNSVHREGLLDRLNQVLPAYYPFFWQAYGGHTNLLYHGNIITSERGVQQGDPLGPLAFCIFIHPMVKMLQSEFNVWYLDDGSLGGDPEIVLQDLKTIISWKEEFGLELNSSKCELNIVSGPEGDKERIIQMFRNIAPGIRVIGSEESCLMGSPLTDEALPLMMRDRLAVFSRLATRLRDLQSHQALYLLKNCLYVPKLLYIIRSSPAYAQSECLRELDVVLRECLQRITNSTLDDTGWAQATLPVSKGGLGIRLIEELALPAYLASVHSVSNLVSILVPSFSLNECLGAAKSKWVEITSCELPKEELRPKQSEWDKPIIEKRYDDLSKLKEHDPISTARLLAVSTKESGAWLNALPSSALGNLLDDDSLRVSISLRLGLSICHRHECQCGELVEEKGYHGLCCRRSAGRHARHGALNDIICRSLVSAGVPSRREPVGVFRQDGKRPDGITLVPWKEGRCLVWDATCVDTLAASHLAASSCAAGSAAMGAEECKTEKYKNLDGRYTFCPLGFETFGAWGPGAKQLVAAIGRRVMEKTGETRSYEFLRQRLSVEIQRGNAASVLGTIPISKGLEEVFFLL